MLLVDKNIREQATWAEFEKKHKKESRIHVIEERGMKRLMTLEHVRKRNIILSISIGNRDNRGSPIRSFEQITRGGYNHHVASCPSDQWLRTSGRHKNNACDAHRS